MFKKNIFMTLLLPLLGLTLLSSCSDKVSEANSTVYQRGDVKNPSDAINLLKEGNQRLISGEVLNKDLTEKSREVLSTKGQNPFAVILSCSDSRIPPEIVFDQGVGDVFVIRNAGNVIEQTALGSIEYGAYKLNAPLIVVLGHEKCGAVEATVNGGATETNIDYIMEKIQPVLSQTKDPSLSKEAITTKTEDENIKYQISKIKESKTIQTLINENKVNVVGAKYDLDTGKVTFID